MRRCLAALALMVVALLQHGCGTAQAPMGKGDPHEGITGGDVPTTSRALAYVTSLYTGPPDSAENEQQEWADEFAGKSMTATDLRFGPDGEYDGDLVAVVVGAGFQPDVSACDALDFETSGCAGIADGGLVMWEVEAPEEDPGVVYVTVPKGRNTVLVSYSGPRITGDPREMELPIPVEALVSLATDPRVDVTTTAEAVEQGRGTGLVPGLAGGSGVSLRARAQTGAQVRGTSEDSAPASEDAAAPDRHRVAGCAEHGKVLGSPALAEGLLERELGRRQLVLQLGDAHLERGHLVLEVEDPFDPLEAYAGGGELGDFAQHLDVAPGVPAAAASGAPGAHEAHAVVGPQRLRVEPGELGGHRDDVDRYVGPGRLDARHPTTGCPRTTGASGGALRRTPRGCAHRAPSSKSLARRSLSVIASR